VNERIEGAPDLIIEIWSPSTGGVDLLTKKYAYEEAGVREYWVVRDIYKIYQYIPDEKGEYEEFIHSAKSDILEVPVHIWNNEFSVKLGKYVLPFQK
jgi:Uma2 family endonuclease